MTKTIVSILLFLFSSVALSLTKDEARHVLSRASERITPENIAHLETLNRKNAFKWLMRNHELEISKPISITWGKVFDEFNETFKLFHEKRNSKSYIRDLINKAEALKKMTDSEGFGVNKLTFNEDDIEGVELGCDDMIIITGHVLNMLWLKKILETKSPFTESMTLFWHGHFTSAFSKVLRPEFMLKQNDLFRKNAFGNFKDLLYEVTLDPAMLIYLDGSTNVKGKPNQNYARELLELYTIGEGNYSEDDIRETSRALTGIKIIENDAKFDPSIHDDGMKTIQGIKAKFTYKEVLDLLLKNSLTAEMIVKKVWLSYISPIPDKKQVKRWAKDFAKSNFNFLHLMEIVFTSDVFFEKKNRMSLVKSPVEFVISHFYYFDIQPFNYLRLVHHERIMGQSLFDPPDVRGWLGGKNWITPSTWLARQKYIDASLSPTSPDMKSKDNKIDEQALHSWHTGLKKNNWKKDASFLLIGERTDNFSAENIRSVLKEIMKSPKYSLK